MGILSRLRAAFGQRGPERGTPTESGAELVGDWPMAAARPATAPDPNEGFEAEDAPPSAIGVLQWTSALLVDGGRGPGSWDFIDLQGWATGDVSGVVPGLGSRGTTAADLELAVGDAVGHPVTFVPSTWVFSREDSTAWWTAPLFVVHRVQ